MSTHHEDNILFSPHDYLFYFKSDDQNSGVLYIKVNWITELIFAEFFNKVYQHFGDELCLLQYNTMTKNNDEFLWVDKLSEKLNQDLTNTYKEKINTCQQYRYAYESRYKDIGIEDPTGMFHVQYLNYYNLIIKYENILNQIQGNVEFIVNAIKLSKNYLYVITNNRFSMALMVYQLIKPTISIEITKEFFELEINIDDVVSFFACSLKGGDFGWLYKKVKEKDRNLFDFEEWKKNNCTIKLTVKSIIECIIRSFKSSLTHNVPFFNGPIRKSIDSIRNKELTNNVLKSKLINYFRTMEIILQRALDKRRNSFRPRNEIDPMDLEINFKLTYNDNFIETDCLMRNLQKNATTNAQLNNPKVQLNHKK
jgi:hypothetical protein